ncbi:aspartyl-phosphate phosphatase Spo0E family protein [Salinibacillus xinjiangensis]|uniref:Spo0E family sporulation regulatory protein-aspartic acid phosphatase n=1 Tax=Salinibacillus xinjiangensis TaxID=1229268 RepID=A0A6G1X487_9BACI|nr:aspartyl-phosphate phosphatase Spo0E family protein [Salinibacillus xinjiangensis]MRG85716.1 Spo0E family sporulation regulatory protein-aspartic acid phosphatase [Salinibacillus xinjiangensis]
MKISDLTQWKIKKCIEDKRKELYSLYKTDHLTGEKIVAISQELDRLLNIYSKVQKY